MSFGVDEGATGTPNDDMAKQTEDTARVGFRLRGAYLSQIRDVQELLGFNTPTEVIQYLAQRGLESLSGSLQVRRTFKRLEGLASPEQMLPLIQAMESGAAPTLKPAEKVS